MGANLAPEVASDNFCEATIGIIFSDYFIFLGTKNAQQAVYLKQLFHTENFRINVVNDAHTVELCGALKVFYNK